MVNTIKVTELTESFISGDDDYFYTVINGESFKIKKSLLAPPPLPLINGSEIIENESLDSVSGLSVSPVTSAGASSNLQIPQDFMSRFFVGQTLKIFGANTSIAALTTPPVIQSVAATGFNTVTNPVTFRYRVAQFDMTNGKISPRSNQSSVVSNVDFNEFNISNFVTVRINRSSATYGLLIYRSTDGGSIYNLIDILGPKQLGSATSNLSFIDYGTFNYNPWSKKNPNNGIYTTSTGLVHFPLSPSSSSQKGWINTTVAGIDYNENRITVNGSFYFDSTVEISHNDTSKLQNEINNRVSQNINNLTLNDRAYIVSALNIPTGFTLVGKGRKTQIKKIPWDNSSNNKILVGPAADAINITLSNFDVQGNMFNQWLKSDPNSDENYAIEISSETFTIDRIHVTDVIGGGIWAPSPSKMLLNFSRVENSGMTDFYEYSPLVAGSGNDVVVTGNVFSNFTQTLDLSVTNVGVFSSNIVTNCGAGVLVFGSKFLISSPNILTGPAGEYLSGPDMINSEYDSVNFDLQLNSDFDLTLKYQENGNDFDLTANRANPIKYEVQKLRKVDNVEELYGEVLINSLSPIQNVIGSTISPDEGDFKLKIASADVNQLLIGQYSYTNLKLIDPDHVGLAHFATLTEYAPSGNINGQGVISGGFKQYSVNTTDFSNLSINTRVRTRNHGGTPDLDNSIGKIINIIALGPNEVSVTIEYDDPVTVAGTSGQITVENSFILTKGIIQ
jgi:hypothetical protein